MIISCLVQPVLNTFKQHDNLPQGITVWKGSIWWYKKAVQLEGRMLHGADRSAVLTGKQSGGCLAVYINRLWCQDSVSLHQLLSKCRAIDSEMSTFLSSTGDDGFFHYKCLCTTKHKHGGSDVRAVQQCEDNISEEQKEHLDAFFIVAGDFNQASLSFVLPKFYQHVNVASRRKHSRPGLYKP